MNVAAACVRPSLASADRDRLRGMIATLEARNSAHDGFYRSLILSVLAEGPATRYELMCAMGARHRNADARVAINEALDALLSESLVRERPELTPARRVRFKPVIVLELSGAAAQLLR